MPQLTKEQQKELQEKLKNMSPEELQEFQKQQCIFCQIISGKVPAKKIYEDQQCIAVLDIRPAAKGHFLILPKEHYAIMPQVPEEVLSHLFIVAKYLSQMLLKALKVEGTNLFIANGPAAGQQAQHVMIHLIPRKEGDQVLNFTEKLIDPELVKKVKMVVQGKLNELLNVKETESKPMKKETKKTKEKKEKKFSKSKEKEPKEEDTPEEPEKDEAADLDDIADMFK